ncbi:MAG: nitroreductase family protein [Chloroflexi bacterium]|nr:nitroreductase family protein [Chloroflexota bacterium]
MSDLDTFMRIVKTRRSVRVFKPDPIPDETVKAIVDAGHWAMSGANGQPWEFIVVKDGAARRRIAELHSAIRKITDALEQSRVPALQHPGAARRPGGIPPFAEAPVLVVILGDPRTLITSVVSASIVTGEREVLNHNMANAAMIMHLAATAAGINSEWISVNSPSEGPLKNFLGVPDIYRLPLMVALGYAAREPRPGFRRNLDDIVHYEKYDLSRFRSSEAVLSYITEIHKHRVG